VDNPQNAAGKVVKYSMQFITGTNRHQTYFGSLEVQLATDNRVRLVDAFFGCAKSPKNQHGLQGALRPAVEKRNIISVCNDCLRQYLRW
jgi:hypothetical protein